MASSVPEGVTWPCSVGADGVREDVKRIDGLEGDLVAGRRDAGRERDAAEIERSLAGRGRSIPTWRARCRWRR